MRDRMFWRRGIEVAATELLRMKVRRRRRERERERRQMEECNLRHGMEARAKLAFTREARRVDDKETGLFMIELALYFLRQA